LTPGPRGIDTSASTTYPYYVYIAGTGTPEVVLVTGGTCTVAGSASCNITFTPANSHSAGFTIQSASAGVAEAQMDAIGTLAGPLRIYTRTAGTTASNNGNNLIFYAPVFIRCSYCIFDGNGGTWALNNNRAVYVLPSSSANIHVTIENARVMSMIAPVHATITNTACSANVATITSTLNPKVGEVVDIQSTNNSFYWGPHVVATTSVGSWTYTATGCGVTTEATAGGNAYQMAIVEDNGSGTLIHNLGISNGAAPYNQTWNNGFVVLNDQQGLEIDHVIVEGRGGGDASYVGSVVYAPGTFVTNPAVVTIRNSSFSMGCALNGVTAYNGNTVSIYNTINQAYAEWGVNGGTQRGGFGGLIMANQYEEYGACTNPVYTPNQAAGVIWWGNTATWQGGEGPAGLMPQFCTGGGTTYYYYIVVKDSVSGPSAPLYIGSSAPSGTTCTIKWPRAQDSVIGTTTTTYDLIRSTDANNAPTTTNCPGGSTSACGSRVLAQAQCNSTLQCSFSDDITLNTTAYTVLLPDFSGSGIGGAVYSPTFIFFPGHTVLQNNAVFNYQGGPVGGGQVGAAGSVMATNGVGPVVSDSLANTVPRSYVRVQTGRGNTSSNVMMKLFDPAGSSGVLANSMGRIGILNPSKGTSGHLYGNGAYLLTLATPKSDEAVASSNPRTLTADPNDTGIGLDIAGSTAANYGTGYSSPTSHSFYVGSLLDGISWKQRISASQTEFNTPTLFDLPMTSLLGCTDCGPFNRTNAYTNDPLQTAPNLSGNWTTILGTWTIGSGTAFPSGNYAYASAIVVEGAFSRAYAYYSGTSFTSDQVAQANLTPINSIIGLCVRMQNAAPVTAYCLQSGSVTRTLIKYVAGIATVLSTSGSNVPNNSTIKISAIGSTISASINGVLFASVTDTAITGGAPGIYAQNLATSNQGIRNFYAASAGYTSNENLTMNNLIPQTLTDGVTITWDVNKSSLKNATVTLAGNRTLNLTNLTSGGNYVLRIMQDATGGRTLALGTGCTWKVVGGGAGAITLTAAASAIDILAFYYDGTNCYATLGTNYN